MVRQSCGLRVVLCLALLSLAVPCTAAIPYTERDALVALYATTNGAGWTNSSGWLGPVGTECSWYGVTCDGSATAVLSLNLSNNNLVGTISPLLKNLVSLQTLELSFNGLSGSIPPQLSNLSNLNALLLTVNQLDGSIPPELGDLSNLHTLTLNGNGLSGSIPPQLGDLSNLEDLNLSYNQLSGSIPSELGSLPSLTFLYLAGNQLSGSIPAQLGSLSLLSDLYLDGNHLEGTIPPALGFLSNLQYLYLDDNQLEGSIPSQLGSLSSLTTLHLRYNQLSGSIPPELANLSALQYLDIRWNALWTDDSTLQAFLDARQAGWDETQTVPPEDVAAGTPDSSSVIVSWTPITYTENSGGYYVFATPSPPSAAIFADGFEGGDTEWWGLPGWWVRTTDKTDTSILVDGLAPGTTYDLTARTVTESFDGQQNQVVSDPSATVGITTAD